MATPASTSRGVFPRLRGQLQTQKQAFTQMRGAGSVAEQPHIVFGSAQSLSLLHSLWQVQLGRAPGPPQLHR
jgi:hypothetical protein